MSAVPSRCDPFPRQMQQQPNRSSVHPPPPPFPPVWLLSETIISWTDPEVATDLALSFQESMGCAYIW